MKRFRGFVCLWGTLGTNTVLQRRNAPAQFVYDIVEMTDCILEAMNSSTQAYISALTGRLCPSISHDWLSAPRSCSFAVQVAADLIKAIFLRENMRRRRAAASTSQPPSVACCAQQVQNFDLSQRFWCRGFNEQIFDADEQNPRQSD